MTRRLLNLEAAISQRNLATLAVLCIEWSTGRTRLYLYAWVLWMWRLRFHAVGNCSSSLGQFSTCRIGRGCALRIANTCFFFLGGNTLETWDDAQATLQTFWDRYKHVDPSLVPQHPSQTVPFYIHGDEGRGLGKRPLLVISFQPTMSWTGGQTIPSTKYLCSC